MRETAAPVIHWPMGSSISFAVVLAALAVQSVSPTPALASLKPSGPWTVEYADDMCLLSRKFGEGTASITLGFKPGMYTEHMRLVITRNAPEGRVARGQAELSFDGGSPLKGQFVDWSVKGGNTRAMVIDLNSSDLSPLNSAKQFRVQAKGLDVTLAPTEIPAAMNALEVCQKDLLITWGMDPASLAAIATFPKLRGGSTSIFIIHDYPSVALRNGEQGTVGVRLWVSKEGKARDCTVVESSGSSALDQQTCAIFLHRGRYEPGRTASGEAVEAIGFTRIRWEMPQE